MYRDHRNPGLQLKPGAWCTRNYAARQARGSEFATNERTYRLSGTLNSDLILSARLDIPLSKQVRIVSLTLSPKKVIFPSVSFSSCCWTVRSRALSSIIYDNISRCTTSNDNKAHATLASNGRSLSSEKNFWAALTDVIFALGSYRSTDEKDRRSKEWHD